MLSSNRFASLQGKTMSRLSEFRMSFRAGPPFEICSPQFHVWPPGCCIHPIQYFLNVAPPSGFWPRLLLYPGDGPGVIAKFQGVILTPKNSLRKALSLSEICLESVRFGLFTGRKYACINLACLDCSSPGAWHMFRLIEFCISNRL